MSCGAIQWAVCASGALSMIDGGGVIMRAGAGAGACWVAVGAEGVGVEGVAGLTEAEAFPGAAATAVGAGQAEAGEP